MKIIITKFVRLKVDKINHFESNDKRYDFFEVTLCLFILHFTSIRFTLVPRKRVFTVCYHKTYVTQIIIILGCRLPSVDFPLTITSFPVLDVYPAGQNVTFTCASGYSLSGSATASCSETTFMFDDLTASCLSS